MTQMKDLVESTTETQPRTIGVLDLRFGGTNQLQNLYQEGASKALFARKQNGAEAICINTSGGITGGDRLTGHFETRDSAHLCVTTQGFERIYRSLDILVGLSRIVSRFGTNHHFIGCRRKLYFTMGVIWTGV